jgi:hypothetical protein
MICTIQIQSNKVSNQLEVHTLNSKYLILPSLYKTACRRWWKTMNYQTPAFDHSLIDAKKEGDNAAKLTHTVCNVK